MVFWDYYLCVKTPPGSVPLGYVSHLLPLLLLHLPKPGNGD